MFPELHRKINETKVIDFKSKSELKNQARVSENVSSFDASPVRYQRRQYDSNNSMRYSQEAGGAQKKVPNKILRKSGGDLS